LTCGADLNLEMSRKATVALGAYLCLYLSWQAFHWLPGDVAQGHLFFLPAGAVAVAACVAASRRCSGVDRLRGFWRLMALAVTAQLLGDTTMALYDISGVGVPFPSVVDLLYLAFYPLILLALLRVPLAPTSRAQRVRLGLDLTTILVGGAILIWHLVVAESLSEGGQSVLQTAVSIAYPVGDLALLGGISVLLLRWSPATLRRPLSLIAAGLALFIAADISFSFTALHTGYTAGGPIDILWVVALILFALAAMSQKTVRRGAPETAIPTREIYEQRVSWLPFAALAVGSLILLDAEWGENFMSKFSVVLAAIGLAILIASRQALQQKEMIRLQRDLRATHDELAELATRDALTSTANRRSIESTLKDEIERARRYGRALSVLFLDIDHFKAINDGLGHAAGDRVLADFAAAVNSCLRPVDSLGRWGGEEFVVVLPETGAGNATKAAERIRAHVESLHVPRDSGAEMTCSIGSGSYPADATDLPSLIGLADGAMYEAKRLGRNRVASAAPELEHA
jgi:diguanylate cyclase (GGDEF)-like protein